jgi:demethylmenaquinone methyltransferase/2-methoxy-6-polyprenyl-1,4-benzoquinol methylase
MNFSLADKERRVQAMFSSVARFYDLNNTLLSLGLHHFWKRETLRLASLSPGARVLDVGAGTCDLSVLSARAARAARAAQAVGLNGAVMAVDLNAPMLRIGQKKLRGLPALCVLGNAQMLSFPDNVFDVALTGFCLRNVSDLDQAIREICRVLKPGGRMVCLEFSRPQYAFLRALYDFYSFTLLPRVGAWVSGDQTGVYQYLPDSIRRFPAQEALKTRMETAGFREVFYRNLSGGIVAIHVGIKAPS